MVKIKKWQDDLFGGLITVGSAFYFLQRRNVLLFIASAAALSCASQKLRDYAVYLDEGLPKDQSMTTKFKRAGLTILAGSIDGASCWYLTLLMFSKPVKEFTTSMGYNESIAHMLTTSITCSYNYVTQYKDGCTSLACSRITGQTCLLLVGLAKSRVELKIENCHKIFLIYFLTNFLIRYGLNYVDGADSPYYDQEQSSFDHCKFLHDSIGRALPSMCFSMVANNLIQSQICKFNNLALNCATQAFINNTTYALVFLATDFDTTVQSR